MNDPSALKLCPACNQSFTGHPSAIYCSPNCSAKAKRQRRARRRQKSIMEAIQQQYQAIYTNPSADDLLRICNDIIAHVYERDIQLIGTVPTIEIPPDVRIDRVPGTNYAIAYHATRGDYSKYFS